MRGQYLEPVTDDMKERFLDLIASGHTRPEAAAAVDQSARVFRSICNPKSHRYDEDFAERYAELTVKDGEHDQAMLERLENAAFERALRSSDRLLEKLLINKSPEWAIHRPQAMQINFNVDEFRAEITQQPTATIEAYVEKKRAELEQGDIIDVEPA